NKKWEKDKIYFDQEDYRILNEACWKNFNHKVLFIELSEAQTTALADRCRKEGVTMTTALTTAFTGAQCIILGDNYQSSVLVAGSVKDRLSVPAGEVMGFYAGGVTLKYKYNRNISFWENSRKFHRKVTPLYTNKNLFKDPLMWCYLEPAILDSRNFKVLGGLVPPRSTNSDKIIAFSKRKDIVSSLLKRSNVDSLDKIFVGTAVTNLTRLDFPRKYGSLELDRLIMNPGTAFPLATVKLVLGAVTCSGKLSLFIEYAEETVDTNTIEKIKNEAMEFLLD
ncbi:MAG: hypothetical protein ACTSRU_17825, partial [Candidatus Hodarchaeales archaeon]